MVIKKNYDGVGADLTGAVALNRALGTEKAKYALEEFITGSAKTFLSATPLSSNLADTCTIRRRVGENQTFVLSDGDSIEMVWVPNGEFTRGSPESEEGRNGREKQQQLPIIHGFWLGKYEVTQKQWESVMGSNPSSNKGPSRPVERVSWNDAQEFIKKLNQFAGSSVYRLPRETEWEYACRAGTTTPWSFGDDKSLLGKFAWYGENNSPDGTKDVGQKGANPWGVHDMHGNVSEWCQDWYGHTSRVSPREIGMFLGSSRILRGGAYRSSANGTRSACCPDISPDRRRDTIGIRLLRVEYPLVGGG